MKLTCDVEEFLQGVAESFKQGQRFGFKYIGSFGEELFSKYLKEHDIFHINGGKNNGLDIIIPDKFGIEIKTLWRYDRVSLGRKCRGLKIIECKKRGLKPLLIVLRFDRHEGFDVLYRPNFYCHDLVNFKEFELKVVK